MESDISTNNSPSLKPVSDIAGLILSAGASSRMGEPKALLKTSYGCTLLSRQVELMVDGGIDTIGVVVGADSDTIIGAHSDLNVRWIENLDWEIGQFSSVQSGLKGISPLTTTGVMILPVDAVGVNAGTLRAIIESALINPHLQVIIPEFEERGGHPIYMNRQFCDEVVKVDLSSEDARLDMQIKKSNKVLRLPTNDPAIIRNINTMQEWEEARSALLK